MQENEPVTAVAPVSAPILRAALPVEPTDAVTSAMNDIPEKPKHFTTTIQGGMLEALGINMYTTLGKCLVEFVANAYDADATVKFLFPTSSLRETPCE